MIMSIDHPIHTNPPQPPHMTWSAFRYTKTATIPYVDISIGAGLRFTNFKCVSINVLWVSSFFTDKQYSKPDLKHAIWNSSFLFIIFHLSLNELYICVIENVILTYFLHSSEACKNVLEFSKIDIA